MTECEKRELIRSIAMGMPFEEISAVYEMSMEEINAFYKENKGRYQRGNSVSEVQVWG